MVMKFLLLLTIFAFANGKHVKRAKVYGRYVFYRDMEHDSGDRDRELTGTRRVFGGVAAELSDFPTAAALLDRYWSIRCSGSVITPYWALTAAHCVTGKVAYIRYNSLHPSSAEGDSSPVLYLYRHPNFKVVQEDEGRGMDVTLLHHDLGLIRTRDMMKLKSPIQPISSMARYNFSDLDKKELTVLGFGRTQVSRSSGEELLSVKLLMVNCDRGSWFHCICGVAGPGQEQAGVCSGDSGGPVVYRSVQVGVTTMGPVECSSLRTGPPEGTTSVFTATYHYVDLINATITDAEQEIKKLGSKLKAERFGQSVGLVLKVHIPIFVFSVFAMVL